MDGCAHEVIGKMLADHDVPTMPDGAARVLRMMCATGPRGAAAGLRGRAERPDHRDAPAGVEAPVLVVVGADDVHTPVAEAEAVHRLVPHAVPAVIEKAGRLPGAEQPDRFDAVLLDFLATRVA